MNPLKQGLKPDVLYLIVNNPDYVVKEVNPLKQGLKPTSSITFSSTTSSG